MIRLNFNNAIKTLATAAAVGALGILATVPALAQSTPTYATGTSDETIKGTIAAINGPYSISVRDERGFIDNVALHQGTIINPRGLTLEPGQSVTIVGQNQGSVFGANEIDTPYAALDAVPFYGYPYGFGYGYGYPAYDVGLHFGRGFGFGFRG